MTDLRAQIEALPWRVWQPQDEPLADAEREWGAGLEWAVSEYRDAVLARIPAGSVLVTPAPTEDGRPPLDPLVAAHDRGWTEGYLAGKAAALTPEPALTKTEPWNPDGVQP
jgi:hypothetical protein